MEETVGAPGDVAGEVSCEQVPDQLAAGRRSSGQLASDQLASDQLASNQLASNQLASDQLASDRLASERVASGQPASERVGYEEFVALRGPALVRLARGLLRDPYLAEDVVQDVLARAMLQWGRVSGAADVDAYVRRMVVNACTSWFRRPARRERATDQPVLFDRVDQASGDNVDQADQFAERDLLLALLRKLPAKQRAVLVLRHYEGLPDAEIALILGSSEVTVRSNAHRGLARLRELITQAQTVPDALDRRATVSVARQLTLGVVRRPRRPNR